MDWSLLPKFWELVISLLSPAAHGFCVRCSTDWRGAAVGLRPWSGLEEDATSLLEHGSGGFVDADRDCRYMGQALACSCTWGGLDRMAVFRSVVTAYSWDVYMHIVRSVGEEGPEFPLLVLLPLVLLLSLSFPLAVSPCV